MGEKDYWKKIPEKIKKIEIQGAREVAQAGLKYLSQKAERSKAENQKKFLSELQETSHQLIQLRPTEPALQNILTQVVTEVSQQKVEKPEKLKKYLNKAAEDRLKQLNSMLETIASFGPELIEDGETVLTHCHSHLVVAMLRKAKSEGRDFKVIVTETRPLYQGKKTATELLKSDIQVIYGVDSIIGHAMKQSTKVLTGCDAILPDGSIVNKIGTLPLAIVAQKFGKPYYVAGETIKMTEKVDIEHRDPKEVIDPEKLSKAEIINPAFDVVPSDLITEIITEKGRTKPGMLERLETRKKLPERK